MSYDLLSERTIKAVAKPHRCIWCPEDIIVGQPAVKTAGSYCGEFQSEYWHPECRAAAITFFRANPGEDELYPHECKRGSTEHR